MILVLRWTHILIVGAKKAAVIITTDVFGHSFINVQLIADSISKYAGVPVFVPDLFNGDALPTSVLTAEPSERGKVYSPSVTWILKFMVDVWCLVA